MKNLTIGEIVNVTNGKLISGNEEQEIENFSKDTRTIEKGALYVGIKGEKFDGNMYFKQAYENGAVACMLDAKNINIHHLKEFSNVIIVEDTIIALQELARYRRKMYNIPVIAVTGSVGKTSTKDIIANVVAQRYDVLKTEGNNNNHIGLPLTLLKLKNQDAIVVEMGMNHFGEISTLTNIAKPTVCVITNIGTSHIGILGSRENILKAKLEILEGLQENGTVVINNDNDLLHNWYLENKNKYNIITYGIENDSKYMARDIQYKEDESDYNIIYDGKKEKINVPIPGEAFVYNSLSAYAVGKILEISETKIATGIKGFELTKKRMEKHINKDGVTIINDAYNASFDSMKAAIQQLKNTAGNKKIAVLGDMLELGEFTKQLHEDVGEEVVKNNIDILITIGEKAKFISEKAKQHEMAQIYELDNNSEAINKIKEIIEKGDVVLLKASNSMRLYEIANELMK